MSSLAVPGQAVHQRDAHPQESLLNPADARNTDSCLAAGGEVSHNYDVGGPAPGNLWFRWIHGSPVAAKNADPRIQVMQYNEDTYVLRENICVDWRGPFTYLLFGNHGALLIDTGATQEPQWYPLRATVEAICARWQSIRRKRSVPLTIVFTSPENAAQNGGQVQFQGRPGVVIMPKDRDLALQFVGLSPGHRDQAGQVDLGGRVLDVLQTPGTHKDGLTFYDRYTKNLFTGDLLFPGRILIANDDDYQASLQRLEQWHSVHPVKWILGGGIDMQFVPGRAYGRFATFKPYERELQLKPDAITRAAALARTLAGKQAVEADADFWMLRGVGPDSRPRQLTTGLPEIAVPRPV